MWLAVDSLEVSLLSARLKQSRETEFGPSTREARILHARFRVGFPLASDLRPWIVASATNEELGGDSPSCREFEGGETVALEINHNTAFQEGGWFTREGSHGAALFYLAQFIPLGRKNAAACYGQIE